jgi:hypothetical protein
MKDIKFTLNIDLERSGYKSDLCQGLKSTFEMGTRFKIKVYTENTVCVKDSGLNKVIISGLKNRPKLETVSSGLKYTLNIGTVIHYSILS